MTADILTLAHAALEDDELRRACPECDGTGSCWGALQGNYGCDHCSAARENAAARTREPALAREVIRLNSILYGAEHEGMRAETIHVREELEAMVVTITAERDAARADAVAADERMAAVLDGTFSVGDGTAQREIGRLRAELASIKQADAAEAKAKP